MPQERGYIPENQQVHVQSEPEQRRPQERAGGGLRIIGQIGAFMAVMLAARVGVVNAAESTNNSEPEVHPQAVTDLVQNGGFETKDPIDPSKPQYWNKVAPNPSILPVYDYQVGLGHSGASSVHLETYGTGPCESNGWITGQALATIDPAKTYTLDFWSGYDPGNRVNPKVIIDWKNSSGQSLNLPDTYTFTNPDANNNWFEFSRTYGSGKDAAIPQGATKATVELIGNPPGACSGTLHFDDVKFTTAATQASVGGIAEQPDLSQLQPAASVSHSSRDTIFTGIEIAVGSATALAGTIAVTGALRRRNRQS